MGRGMGPPPADPAQKKGRFDGLFRKEGDDMSKYVEFNMILHIMENRHAQCKLIKRAFSVSAEQALHIVNEARDQHTQRGSFMVRCTVEQFGLFILWRNKLDIKNRVAELDATLIDLSADEPLDLRPGQVA